ncbi:MAG: NADH-ubiquinone oxidoreductase chain D, partial [uncultured Corynebacteriales bacterium]
DCQRHVPRGAGRLRGVPRDHRRQGAHRLRRRLGRVPGRGRRRGPDRAQLRPPAPVLARGAPAGAGDGGRDDHQRPPGHRLPAHRHREEHRIPDVDPGRHLRDADGLPVPVLQRDGVLPLGRAAARGRGAGAGAAHPDHPDGAQPHLLAPGQPRGRRHGAGRADRDDDGLPGARAGPGRLRADHRPADEPRLHPPRRCRAGPPARRGRGDPPGGQLPRRQVPGVRQAPHRPADLEGPPAGRRLPVAGRLPRPRRDRPGAALRRAALGPAQDRPVHGLRGVRLRGPDLDRLRQLRALPAPAGGDAAVAAHRHPGAGPAGAGPGDGGGPQDRLAGAARARAGRPGQLPRPRQEDHGSVDGVADPPLQAGHRGLPGATGPGLHRDRVAARRARLPRRLRRGHPTVPRARARPRVRQPAGAAGDDRGRPAGRPHPGAGRHRPGDGRRRPL